MSGALSDLRASVGFLTVLGGPGAPSSGAMGWFPVVGAAIGGLVGLVWWGADELWTPLLAAILAFAADAMLTGALHHDGLADAADGLLPHMERSRRLEVMRTPDVGTFGIMALVTTSLIQVGSLAALRPEPALLAGLWCASRSAMAVAARTQLYARAEGGLASSFLGGSAGPVALLGAVIALPLAGWSAGLGGVVSVFGVVVGATGVVSLARRRVGGFTGDVLGAAGVIGQTLGLLVAAARW